MTDRYQKIRDPAEDEGRTITDADIAKWESERGNGMTSAVGEYTPKEFWLLLDEVKRLRTAPPSAHVGVEGHYHPCTSILIEGLKRLEGGSDVLAEWDRARAKADAALAAMGGQGEACVCGLATCQEPWESEQAVAVGLQGACIACTMKYPDGTHEESQRRYSFIAAQPQGDK